VDLLAFAGAAELADKIQSLIGARALVALAPAAVTGTLQAALQD